MLSSKEEVHMTTLQLDSRKDELENLITRQQQYTFFAQVGVVGFVFSMLLLRTKIGLLLLPLLPLMFIGRKIQERYIEELRTERDAAEWVENIPEI
jgi:hypothetical protein